MGGDVHWEKTRWPEKSLLHVIVSRARQAYKDRGLKACIIQVFKRILAPVMRTGSVWFFERDLSAPMPPLGPIEGIELREASSSDIALLDCLEDAPEQRQQAQQRLQKGDLWYVSIEEATGRLTNYRWVSMKGSFIPEINRTVVLKPGEAYIYDLFTLPEFRRRRIEAVSRQFIYKSLYERYRATRLIVYVRAENHIGLQAGKKYLTPLARIWYVQFRGGMTHLLMRKNPRMPQLQGDATASRAPTLARPP